MLRDHILGYYGYWVILTYLGVISAIVGIDFAISGNIKYAVICLMVSGLCDMFDGPLARLAKRTDREKFFGIQIDSLADIIAFGVFPAAIGYAVCSDYMVWVFGSLGMVITFAIMSVYLLAALIRLAYFNVIETELQTKSMKRTYYEGLPVTSVALILPIIYSICLYFDIYLPPVYSISLIIISIAFLLKVKIPKLRMRYLIGFCFVGLPFVLYVFLSNGM